MTKVLLIGSGITGAISCAILRREIPNINLIIWEKSKEAGGRMATILSSSNKRSSVDLGFQYLSMTPHYQKKHNFYCGDLASKDLITELSHSIGGFHPPAENLKHYVTPLGSSSIVKYYINQANPEVRYGHCVSGIYFKNGKWEVHTSENKSDIFDVIILTIPVPQIFQLSGTISSLIEQDDELKINLGKVVYSSRFVLAMFYDDNASISLPGGHCSQYVDNDPIIRYVSVDNQRRGKAGDAPSIVVHTTISYGKENLERSIDEVGEILISKVQSMFPSLSKPKEVKCHKWRFSQVLTPYDGAPGAINLRDGLIAGGDGFSSSNLSSCIDSAEAICKHVIDFIDKRELI